MDYYLDAKNKILGRLSSEIAVILQGKKSSKYEPRIVSGDRVFLKNYKEFAVTGRKWGEKLYHRHTGYMGGLKETPYRRLKEKKPTEIMRKAVLNMLPHNRLRAPRMKRLKISA